MTAATRVLSLLEAMATPHPLDRYLELVDPMATVRDLRARIVAVRRRTPDTVTLTLRPSRQWRGHRAGQFVQVGVVVDGVRHTRCFSPAGAEGDRDLELTVKDHGDGLVTRHLRTRAAVGTVVDLSPADGTFTLPDPRPSKVLLISGGSGITPVLSMLRTLLAEGYGGQLAFLHYARRPSEVPYLDELRELAGRGGVATVALAYTASGDGDLRGRLESGHLDAVAPWFVQAETYLCGPESLLQATRELYEHRGIGDRLHVEEFAPPLVPAGRDVEGVTTFGRSGIAAANTGTSLLEQAEAAGLTPEYGCRMGICFTCTTVRESGCTRNLRTGDLDSEPDTPIQLCVNAAVGDVTLGL